MFFCFPDFTELRLFESRVLSSDKPPPARTADPNSDGWRVWPRSPSDGVSDPAAALEQVSEGVVPGRPVSSTGRCCSWPGRWSCSLQGRGRSSRWGRRTPRTRPVPGRPGRAMACRRPAGGRPAEWCWRPRVSGIKNTNKAKDTLWDYVLSLYHLG